jgi:hypothetical protein
VVQKCGEAFHVLNGRDAVLHWDISRCKKGCCTGAAWIFTSSRAAVHQCSMPSEDVNQDIALVQ